MFIANLLHVLRFGLLKNPNDDILTNCSMNFLLIALCLFAGWILRSTAILPQDSHKGINIWILYVALPSVALLYIPDIKWSNELVMPIAMPFIVWTGAWIVMRLVAPHMRLDKGTSTSLLLTGGLGNTSFIGFPLTQAYFGDDGLRIAVICDQISFLVLSTLGVISAMHASNNGRSNVATMFRSILRFPSFLAFVAALTLPSFIDMKPMNPLFERLADTLVPLALFSVGMQLRVSEWRSETTALALGLTYKLLVAPVIILATALLFRLSGVVPQTSVFESAMPPMITSAILAAEYQLNPKLSNLMVSIGLLLSLATTALWWLAVRLLL